MQEAADFDKRRILTFKKKINRISCKNQDYVVGQIVKMQQKSLSKSSFIA